MNKPINLAINLKKNVDYKLLNGSVEILYVETLT